MATTVLPLVSIVTPVFNGEKFLRRTIESVLSQSYARVEYIVVDGASTDRTLDVLDRYRGEITITISEPDHGMYDALNKGFQRSSGDILCYLNADDYFFPDTVELVVDHFLSTRVELVFGNCIYVDNNERELFRYFGVSLPYVLTRRLGRIPFAQQSAFWSRRLYLEIGGFDHRYRYVADTKFFYECLRRTDHSESHLHEFLSMFRQHDEAFSRKAYREMAVEHDMVLSSLGLKVGISRYFVEAIVKGRNWRNFIRRLF